jgi:hypothetical protein
METFGLKANKYVGFQGLVVMALPELEITVNAFKQPTECKHWTKILVNWFKDFNVGMVLDQNSRAPGQLKQPWNRATCICQTDLNSTLIVIQTLELADH